MKLLKHPLVLILITTTIAVFYFRWVFIKRYDATYWHEYYYASQWKTAQSSRTMGDNDLFPYVGFELINGADPFDANPETPPLGKYFLGLSIKLFNNPNILNIPLYSLSALIFFKLCQYIFKQKAKQRLALILFLLSPIIISQLPLRLLDLPQTFVLLLHIYVIYNFAKAKKFWSKFTLAIASGLTLGAFPAIKPGAFMLAIVVADLWLLYKNKKILWFIPLLFIAASSYTLSYIQYFVLGHSLIDWLKAEKWVANFYSSGVKSSPHLFLITSLFGLFKGWWPESTWHFIREWSIIWPLGCVSLIYLLRHQSKFQLKKNPLLSYSLIFSVTLITSYLLVPFWPRYLILLSPFLIIFFIKFIQLKSRKIVTILIIVSLLQAVIASYPYKDDLIWLVEKAWTNQHYRDLYEYTNKDFKQTISRQEFDNKLLEFNQQYSISSNEIKIISKKVWPWQNQASGEVLAVYKTPLRERQAKVPISFIKEHNQWRLNWSWDYLTLDY